MRYDLRGIRATKPGFLVLEIGSNDLCEPSADPEVLGESITVFVKLLRHDIQHKFTVICQVIPSWNPPSELQSESQKAKQVPVGHVGRF